jgi:hypothetical protein
MRCIHCQKDYFNNTVTVQYEGLFNYEEMMLYVKASYKDVVGVMIDHERPSDFNGLKNVGTVVIK